MSTARRVYSDRASGGAKTRGCMTGTARYTDDITLPGMAYAPLLRSPHAHARIRASTPPGAGRGGRGRASSRRRTRPAS